MPKVYYGIDLANQFESSMSVDTFLGMPFNIASYALLTHMVAHVTGLDVGEFILTSGDTHLYKNHVEQAALQEERIPFDLPTLRINKATDNIFDIGFDDIELINYQHHAAIKAPIAV
jgi:thymidylate synthase